MKIQWLLLLLPLSVLAAESRQEMARRLLINAYEQPGVAQFCDLHPVGRVVTVVRSTAGNIEVVVECDTRAKYYASLRE